MCRHEYKTTLTGILYSNCTGLCLPFVSSKKGVDAFSVLQLTSTVSSGDLQFLERLLRTSQRQATLEQQKQAAPHPKSLWHEPQSRIFAWRRGTSSRQ